MLKNTPAKNVHEKKKRKIIFIIIGIICVLATITTIALEIMNMSTSETEIPEKPIVEIKEFSSIFDNQLNFQEFEVKQVEQIKQEEQIVYTTYQFTEKSEGKYDIDIKLPALNINSEKVATINKEISDIFKVKAQSIMSNEDSPNIIYTVEYTAYINSNILSLVIRSNLKEGKNAQRVIVKSYTYNITSGELIGIDEMIAIKQLDKTEVRKAIDKVVSENAKQNESLKNLGYHIYERNLNDEMYNVDNVKNFFYGPNGVLYIIFAYGNNNFTAELDVIPIQ